MAPVHAGKSCPPTLQNLVTGATKNSAKKTCSHFHTHFFRGQNYILRPRRKTTLYCHFGCSLSLRNQSLFMASHFLHPLSGILASPPKMPPGKQSLVTLLPSHLSTWNEAFLSRRTTFFREKELHLLSGTSCVQPLFFFFPHTVGHAYNDHVGTAEFDRFIRVTALTVNRSKNIGTGLLDRVTVVSVFHCNIKSYVKVALL